MGLQCLCHRLRRLAALGWPPFRSLRGTAHLHPRLRGLDWSLTPDHRRHLGSDLARWPRPARIRVRSDRTRRSRPLDDALLARPKGIDQGVRPLRRGRASRWYRWRLSRRLADRCGRLAVGLLHQCPDRLSCPRRDQRRSLASGHCPAGQPRCRGCALRHGGPLARRLCDRARQRSRLACDGDRPRARRGRAVARALYRYPKGAPSR